MFYNYNAFKGYKFIETEPYEFIELNNDSNSSQMMIYLKSDKYYAVLVSAEDNIEKMDYNWDKSKKKINAIVSYHIKFELCWYLYDGNYPPIGRFGIGINTNKKNEINEYSSCELYEKHKVFDVDYMKGEIKEVLKEDSTFCCSSGY